MIPLEPPALSCIPPLARFTLHPPDLVIIPRKPTTSPCPAIQRITLIQCLLKTLIFLMWSTSTLYKANYTELQ